MLGILGRCRRGGTQQRDCLIVVAKQVIDPAERVGDGRRTAAQGVGALGIRQRLLRPAEVLGEVESQIVQGQELVGRHLEDPEILGVGRLIVFPSHEQLGQQPARLDKSAFCLHGTSGGAFGAGTVPARQQNLRFQECLDADRVQPFALEGRHPSRGEPLRQARVRIETRIERGRGDGVFPEGRAQRITDDDRLPAHVGHGEVERLGEIHAPKVGGKQDLRPDGRVEKRLGHMRGHACSARSNEVARE